MFNRIIKQIGMVSHELILSGILLGMYLSGSYLALAPTLQTVMLKATLVSLGFIHATIANKIAFPAINWGDADEDKTDKIRAIVLYGVFVYSYAMGG